jgi:2-polyprenyl-6-methoxyphenol hydroxylase-like FAD-dependent oxidoreductase
MANTDLLIRGDGPVGATLALSLARLGLNVAVLGAPPAAPAARAPDIRAYALNAASQALLADLRVWDALPAHAATAVLDMRIFGDDGGAIEFSAWQQCVDTLAWIVDAAALEQALHTVLRFAPHVRRVGEAVPAGLVAVCEGKDSATREALGAGFERHAYGHSALATRLVCEQPHGGVAWQWFRSPDVLALLPLDAPEPGRSFALVWSQPQAAAESHRDAPPAAFEAALAEATAGAAGALRLAGERATWPLALGRAGRWCGPGWVLLGDAAHQVHPLAGQGLNLGLGDVAALARLIGQARREAPWRSIGDERILRRYARERAAPTLAMGQLTDGLLHLFSHTSPPIRELRNRGLNLVNHLSPVKRWLAGRAFGQ